MVKAFALVRLGWVDIEAATFFLVPVVRIP